MKTFTTTAVRGHEVTAWRREAVEALLRAGNIQPKLNDAPDALDDDLAFDVLHAHGFTPPKATLRRRIEKAGLDEDSDRILEYAPTQEKIEAFGIEPPDGQLLAERLAQASRSS